MNRIIFDVYVYGLKKKYPLDELKAGLSYNGWQLTYTAFSGAEASSMKVQEYLDKLRRK